jgi:hypothetical protein
MIVVPDTSPLNYLVLVEADRFLPSLFGKVVVPPGVVGSSRLGTLGSSRAGI